MSYLDEVHARATIAALKHADPIGSGLCGFLHRHHRLRWFTPLPLCSVVC
jgi:hypothetical protein